MQSCTGQPVRYYDGVGVPAQLQFIEQNGRCGVGWTAVMRDEMNNLNHSGSWVYLDRVQCRTKPQLAFNYAEYPPYYDTDPSFSSGQSGRKRRMAAPSKAVVEQYLKQGPCVSC